MAKQRKTLEDQIHVMVCDYLRLKYPHVIFTTESSGIRLSIGAAKKLKKKRSCSGLPDLLIFYPSGEYSGLFIEIKQKESDVFNKKGVLRCLPHILEQYSIIMRLKALGYCAEFGFGFDDCRQIIDNYMNP
jgi:hypothetical protein